MPLCLSWTLDNLIRFQRLRFAGELRNHFPCGTPPFFKRDCKGKSLIV
jgi:hypothetical protein